MSAVAAVLLALPASAQVWEVDNFRVDSPVAQTNAAFGAGLAIGDFDGDGVHDLAVGAPGWAGPPGTRTGGWSVYWGSALRTLTPDWPGLRYYGSTAPLDTGSALAAGDFDGDGRDEIAVGAPAAQVGADVEEAGVVVVDEFEGGAWTTEHAVYTQGPLPGTDPEAGDHFGNRMTVGDFDGDGYDDLAIAAPNEDWGADESVGVVHVLYGGTPGGLSTLGAVTIVSPNGTAWELFGFALAAGDFDGDGYDDLAIGAPQRAVSALSNAGAVEIYSGSASGIVASSPQLLTDVYFIDGLVEADEKFGWALAAGNFNQSALKCALPGSTCYDDLAIGVPGQAVTGHADAGRVVVGYGGADGIANGPYSPLSPESVHAVAEVDDSFGYSLAAGHLDRDLFGFDDLAIGTPYENWSATSDGVIHLVFGSSGELNEGDPAQLIAQRAGLAVAPAESGDAFGYRIVIGDLDGDGWGDLVVRAMDGTGGAGMLQVLYGALFADGLERGGSSGWSP